MTALELLSELQELMEVTGTQIQIRFGTPSEHMETLWRTNPKVSLETVLRELRLRAERMKQACAK